MKRVVIVGGGIAGLSLAHRLLAAGRGVEVTVLERADRPGGPIRTEEVDGFRFEWGPNGFLDNAPDTMALVQALGLGDRLLPSRDAARRRYVLRAGRLHALPGGPLSFLGTRLLSPWGKIRIALEPWSRARPPGDETLDAFATRRFGAEAAKALVAPMATGVFAGDSRELSLAACFPRVHDLEAEHGSLFRALFARRGRRRPPGASALGRLTSFRGGMEELVRALARSLGPSLRLGTAVRGLVAGDGSSRFGIALEGGARLAADTLVLAGPAADTARLVEPRDPEAAALLRQVPSAPVGVVGLGYPASVLARPLDGFGFLVARGEGARLLGTLWESSVFPERAPDGSILLRVMVGGARDPDALDLPDDHLLARVREELQTTMGLDGAPTFVRIVRHRVGIPQYTLGHRARLERLEERLTAGQPGLFLAGSCYRGVAVNSCIADAGRLAESILAAAWAEPSVPAGRATA